MRKTTRYFDATRARADRAEIDMDWIESDIENPERTEVQADGRIRIWGKISETDDRYLRVILLEDGETLHNAFFDRGYKR